MFISLFLKECKKILKSITYYIFLACMILFFVGQMGTLKGVVKPAEGEKNYGTKYSDDEDVIMQSTIDKLVFDTCQNSYVTYPIGFYKQVKLNEKDQDSVYEILEKVTGEKRDELNEEIKNYKVEGDSSQKYINIKSGLTFQEFSEYMDKVDDILGGGSYYNPKRIYKNTRVPKTYEDALAEYESIINDDKVSNAYARLFCDYMGFVLGILPVFLAVTISLKDKRSKAEDVIFSKKVSSAGIILTRYLSLVVMILIPLIIISITPALQSSYCAAANGINADNFAFIKHILGWLLPTILFTLSIGFLLTEITGGLIAILVQGLYWFVSSFLGSSNLVGYVGMNLMPRFNTVGDYDIYIKIFHELVINRLIYSALGILLIVITIFIYDKKRRGSINRNGKIFKNK